MLLKVYSKNKYGGIIVRNNIIVLFQVLILSLFISQKLYAHCQIPCGIYTDEMRFEMIKEDITTIEKSMNEIIKLSKEGEKNYNQLVRWITNKDEHASKIQDVVNVYFLTQRISPVNKADQEAYTAYTYKLSLLHQLLFYAMKTKQTTDLEHITKLRSLLSEFHDAYFGPEEKKHLEDHHN
jgi:nickel superoxide dismutase